MADCNETYMDRAIALSEALRCLAEEGEANTDDRECFIVFGIIRDCAYKIRQGIERAKNAG
jgi:hypothetical protein